MINPDIDIASLVVPPPLAAYTGYLLRAVHDRALKIAATVVPAGRSVREFGVLSILVTGPASQQQLADTLHVNRTMMVQVVDRLEADGLVERRRNPADRRSYALQLTPAGQKAFVGMIPAVEKGQESLLSALSKGERKRLNSHLRAVGGLRGERIGGGLEDRTGYLLAKAHFATRDRVGAAIAPIAIEPKHFGALSVLDDLGPSPQQRIAEQLGISGTMIVQIVDDLEAKGLVERRRNPADRRSYALEMTAAGRAALKRARRAIAKVEEEIVTRLGAHGAEDLRSLLRRILGAPR
jgi:DNA-binding MarR family transcriptional regulator